MPDQLPFDIGERMTYGARVALGAAEAYLLLLHDEYPPFSLAPM